MRTELDKTVIHVVKMTATKNDFYYWRSQPHLKRLEALEQIRSEYINWKCGAEQGFQRVYRVTKLK